MKITVIVPTYKPQAYLWECLDSIYNQTLQKSDYELVLVLNGCNEPYKTQILEWLSKHKDMKVQFFQTDMGGVSNARNIVDAEKVNNAKLDLPCLYGKPSFAVCQRQLFILCIKLGRIRNGFAFKGIPECRRLRTADRFIAAPQDRAGSARP